MYKPFQRQGPHPVQIYGSQCGFTAASVALRQPASPRAGWRGVEPGRPVMAASPQRLTSTDSGYTVKLTLDPCSGLIGILQDTNLRSTTNEGNSD